MIFRTCLRLQSRAAPPQRVGSLWDDLEGFFIFYFFENVTDNKIQSLWLLCYFLLFLKLIAHAIDKQLIGQNVANMGSDFE